MAKKKREEQWIAVPEERREGVRLMFEAGYLDGIKSGTGDDTWTIMLGTYQKANGMGMRIMRLANERGDKIIVLPQTTPSKSNLMFAMVYEYPPKFMRDELAIRFKLTERMNDLAEWIKDGRDQWLEAMAEQRAIDENVERNRAVREDTITAIYRAVGDLDMPEERMPNDIVRWDYDKPIPAAQTSTPSLSARVDVKLDGDPHTDVKIIAFVHPNIALQIIELIRSAYESPTVQVGDITVADGLAVNERVQAHIAKEQTDG